MPTCWFLGAGKASLTCGPVAKYHGVMNEFTAVRPLWVFPQDDCLLWKEIKRDVDVCFSHWLYKYLNYRCVYLLEIDVATPLSTGVS